MSIPRKWTKSETWTINQQNYEGNYKLFLKGQIWKEKVAAVWKRTRGICENCGDPAEHCHHRHYQKPWGYEDPDTDLQALCKECHEWVHGRSFNKNETLEQTLKRLGY